MELFGLLILIKISTHVPDWVKKMTRCAMLQPGESLDEAMVKADQAMYADKAAIKMKQKKERRTSRD